jgi:hypothetical protein
MKESSILATEIRTYTFPSEKMPDWKEAKQLLEKHGKVLMFK